MGSGSPAHLLMFFGAGEDSGYCGGELAVGDDSPGFAVVDYGARAAVGSYHRGDSAGQGFKDHIAEGIRVRGEDEEVHVGVGAGEGFAFQDAGKLRTGKTLAEPAFQRAVAYDHVAEALVALLLKLLLHLGQLGYVFFDGETAYEAQHLVAIFGVAIAFLGMEEIGVYSARHEVAGAFR